LKCNDFDLCAKVFVNFTMVYIFTFGKLAYIILQSNVDIISKNFPKKKKSINLNQHTSLPSKSMPIFKSAKEDKI